MKYNFTVGVMPKDEKQSEKVCVEEELTKIISDALMANGYEKHMISYGVWFDKRDIENVM
jgi:hypothetical protein